MDDTSSAPVIEHQNPKRLRLRAGSRTASPWGKRAPGGTEAPVRTLHRKWAHLRWDTSGRHNGLVPLPPWIIDELEIELERRQEQERVPLFRVELPQAPVCDEGVLPVRSSGGFQIVEISPRDLSVIDL